MVHPRPCNPDKAVMCKGAHPGEPKSAASTKHLIATNEQREMDIPERDLTHSRRFIYLFIYNTRSLEN